MPSSTRRKRTEPTGGLTEFGASPLADVAVLSKVSAHRLRAKCFGAAANKWPNREIPSRCINWVPFHHHLGHKKNLADVFAVLDEVMSIGRFIKFEALRNLRLDDALRPQIEYLLAPAADAIYLAPRWPKLTPKTPLLAMMSDIGLN